MFPQIFQLHYNAGADLLIIHILWIEKEWIEAQRLRFIIPG